MKNGVQLPVSGNMAVYFVIKVICRMSLQIRQPSVSLTCLFADLSDDIR
jgi:hypothetical protein